MATQSVKRSGLRAFAGSAFALAALLTTTALHSAPVHAQTLGQLISLQVGVGEQTTSKARNQVGSDSLHVGASLNFGHGSTLFVLPGTQSVDFDYNYAYSQGSKLNAYSLMYANRIDLIPGPLQSLTHKVVPYAGFGVGVIDAQVNRHYGGVSSSLGPIHPPTSGSKDTLAGKLMLGVDLPSNLFVEGSYILAAGSADGLRPDNLDIALGYKF